MSGASPAPVYTVADESRYLVVKNVPALGCIEELVKLFGSYGPIEEYRLMDEEDCEPYTDIYWIKFVKISNARFAKRKLDEFNFLGNLLQVSYAPMYESVMDTKDKLEERRSLILSRLRSENQGHPKQHPPRHTSNNPILETNMETAQLPLPNMPIIEARQQFPPQPQYFPSASMNATVQAVREKLNQISEVGGGEASRSSLGLSNTLIETRELSKSVQAASTGLYPPQKRPRTADGRRRI